MAKKAPAAKQVALWRYEQIELALGEDIPSSQRGQILRRLSRTPVSWPSGASRRISLASLYRWLNAYLKNGLSALRPVLRKDRGQKRRVVDDEVVTEALRLLQNDPAMSLTLLLAVLHAKFPAAAPLPRSTLHRRLVSHVDYQRIQRLKHRTQARTRFVAKGPHDIWHTDAKGPFPVLLLSRITILVHVLTILDDATRAVLAALVVPSPTLGAAVRTFRRAAERYGLCSRLYADRASIFESHAFRAGLADLGAHRICTRARNPEAHGKIEAYHRTLEGWFCARLHAQRVVDSEHLQQLLDAVIGAVYQPHKHRGLKISPEAALAGRVSARNVSPTRLLDAFRQEKRLKAHPKTGEVELLGRTFLVPEELRGQKLTFLLDPAEEALPLVVHPASGAHYSLRQAAIRAEQHVASQQQPRRWADGPLQAIHDHWRGQERPLSEPGFGLPELYQLLTVASGRQVPASDAEGALVHRFWRENGPLPRAPTETAFAIIGTKLGQARPIKSYLDALTERVCKPGESP